MQYNLVACGNSGQFDAAFDLFNQMKSDCLQPDLVAYNALIAAGMNGNKPEQVSKHVPYDYICYPV